MKRVVQAAAIGMTLFCAAAQAAPVMPSFSAVPTGWTTDRYDPNSFSNVGTYQGRSDVLGIGISSADSFTSRPSAYQSTFYNTQGKGHAISGAAGSVLSADLYVPGAWDNTENGNVRTDMWGVMSNTNVLGDEVSDYTIIGFTNYGNAGARLRVWDSDLAGGSWIDVLSLTAFDSWMALSIDFTGSSYVYRVNGNIVFTDTTISDTTHFSSVLMQAYNFGGDPSITDATARDYTANWSNTAAAAVPEPGNFALLAIGLFGFAAVRRRGGKSVRAS